MATGQDRRVMRQLGTLLTVGTGKGLTDGQLLERFATRQGDAAEQAFAALVERHGPMVLRVCRGVLADSHDAEDAFQATFMVLVRKARGLWVEDSLGPWLHQVALRTASCARSAAARRARHERIAASTATAASPAPDDGLGRLLHEEIGRLPERFRVPVVLCDLEGRTHEQAARHLGWPVGTVKSRLFRARERLRDRLTRRGLSPTASLVALLRPGSLAELIPAHLVSSTTSVAIRFGASRAILGGAAAVLAQGVLTAMSMTRWWKVASLLLVAGVAVSSAGLIAGRPSSAVEPGAQAAAKAGTGIDQDMPVAQVHRDTFRVAVTQRGSLEASRTSDVVSALALPTTIISLVPEGTKVKKGDLVGELDSASLRDQLVNQKRIATKIARANYENAHLEREVAEVAVGEYQEGIYRSERSAAQGEIKLAESAFAKARARAERLRSYREQLIRLLKTKGVADMPGDILARVDLDDRLDSAEQDTLREKLSLERAQSKLSVLDSHSKKSILELRSEVERKRSNELVNQQRFELEASKEDNLERQIAACKLVAPGDGLVAYANEPNRSSGPSAIEEGATVLERQLIARIYDLAPPMQVNCKVAEAMVDQVQPGHKADVRIDAFPGHVFSGIVTSVAPRPDPARGPNQVKKVYTTRIKLDQSFELLRPGMTADSEIVLSDRENILTVPVQAVLSFEGKDHVAVKKADDGFAWREVELGKSDSSRVEVKRGIEPGDEVALKPIDLLSEHEKRLKGLVSPGGTAPVTEPAAK
jgi:HlyD family secretion protein